MDRSGSRNLCLQSTPNWFSYTALFGIHLPIQLTSSLSRPENWGPESSSIMPKVISLLAAEPSLKPRACKIWRSCNHIIHPKWGIFLSHWINRYASHSPISNPNPSTQLSTITQNFAKHLQWATQSLLLGIPQWIRLTCTLAPPTAENAAKKEPSFEI